MNKNLAISFVLGAALAGVIAWLARPSSPSVPVEAAITVAPAATPPHPTVAPSTGAPAAMGGEGQAVRADAIDVLAERLKARLEKEPNDMNGWVLLARSYHYLQRWDEAQAAFAKAKSLGYKGEAEPLPADAQMQSSTVASDPVFEDVSRVVQQKSAQLQAGQQ